MTPSGTLQDKIETARQDIDKAEKEVRKLQDELQAGTADRLKLQSGLQCVQDTICKIAAHLPTFSK